MVAAPPKPALHGRRSVNRTDRPAHPGQPACGRCVRKRKGLVIGSPAVAAFIAYAFFWGLLVYGLAVAQITGRGAAGFVVLWLVGLFGLPMMPYEPARMMFSSYVAALDIALVFAIFKGDVRLFG